MKNLKKILPKLIFFLVITIAVILVIFSLNDFTEIGSVLSTIIWSWLGVGIVFLLLYMIFYPMPLYFLGKSKEEGNIKFTDTMLIGSMEYFFNGLTPFSAGGQPFQIYAYSKVGVSPHRASGIILMNFVITQISIVFLCLFSLFFYEQLTSGVLHLQIMIGVGLGINIFILCLFCSVGLSKSLRKVMHRFVQWLFNLKIFKGKLVKYVDAFDQYCEGAQTTFRALLNRKGTFALCVLLKVIGLTFFYMIPFFILKALNIEIKLVDLPLITAMTTFSIAMTCFIPTPGASGGIEFAFQSLFITVIPTITSAIAASGMLLWRFITYYFLMLISFVIYLIFEQVILYRKKKISKMNNIQENNL